jgi:hypothetical protein
MDLSDLSKLDIVTAAVCGWCSYYAYFDDAGVFYQNLLPATKINRTPPDSNAARPQGWVLKLPECNIVVFAGTTEINQLYAQCMSCTFSPVMFAPAHELCHTKWGQWARDVYANYFDPIRAAINDNVTIFCGHSAGGAVATILFRMAAAAGLFAGRQAGCYTFGCPRVGNKALADQLVGTFNIIRPEDIVPKLPYAGMVTNGNILASPPVYGAGPTRNFWRHGNVVYLTDDGHVSPYSAGGDPRKADNSAQFDAIRFVASKAANFAGFGRSPVLTVRDSFNSTMEHHLMRGYLDLLLKALGGWEQNLIDNWRQEAVQLEQQLPPDPDPRYKALATIPFDRVPAIDPGVTPLRHRRHH